MRVSYRGLMEMVRFFLFFVICSLLCYGVVTLVTDRFLPVNPHREPHGNAVKVITVLQGSDATDLDWYHQRLQLFYLVGE